MLNVYLDAAETGTEAEERLSYRLTIQMNSSFLTLFQMDSPNISPCELENP